MVGWVGWAGGVGGVCKVIFVSNPTVVLRLGWGWGFDNTKHYLEAVTLTDVWIYLTLKEDKK